MTESDEEMTAEMRESTKSVKINTLKTHDIIIYVYKMTAKKLSLLIYIK